MAAESEHFTKPVYTRVPPPPLILLFTSHSFLKFKKYIPIGNVSKVAKVNIVSVEISSFNLDREIDK